MNSANVKTLTREEKVHWLRLIKTERIGPVTFFRLLERFGTAKAALDALPEMSLRGGGKRPVKVCPLADAEKLLEDADALGAHLIAWGEPDYPPLLARIEDPPPLITALGHPHLLRKAAVALVGARNASLNGRRFAEKLARGLGAGGFLVVSGLARGIDASAHAGALDSGTAAVVGGGVDIVYPKENAELRDQIVERGVLISEADPGTVPQARHFPRRNRLISGMARGVVVVEATAKSGSLITARMALDQNREVFAVPGPPTDPRAAGTNDLIRQGATLTESADDVIQALRDMSRPMVEEPNALDFNASPPSQPTEEDIEPARREIIEMLGPSPVEVDEIIRACQTSTPAVVSLVLLELELAGRLERHPGGKVALLFD